MQDNPKRGELDPAEDVCRRCMKNFPVLSCIGKRTREGCDRDSKVVTVHNRRDRPQGPIPLRKPKESGRKESCEILSPSRIAGMSYLCNGRGQWVGNMGKGKCCSVLASESTSSLPGSSA